MIGFLYHAFVFLACFLSVLKFEVFKIIELKVENELKESLSGNQRYTTGAWTVVINTMISTPFLKFTYLSPPYIGMFCAICLLTDLFSGFLFPAL